MMASYVPDLLEPLKIVTDLSLEVVGVDLEELAVTDVLLTVEEPIRDLELAGLHDDGHELVNLSGRELTSAVSSM